MEAVLNRDLGGGTDKTMRRYHEARRAMESARHGARPAPPSADA
jgi:hypothetical protein